MTDPPSSHRRRLGLFGAAVVGLACGKPASTTPPATVDVAGAPAGRSDPVPPRVEPEGPDASALARRLVEKRDAVLCDMDRGVVVHVDVWLQEGTGEGMRVVRRSGGDTTTLAERAADEELDPSALVAEVATALEGAEWTVLEKTRWDTPSTPLELHGITATFDAPTLTLRRGAKEATASIGPPSATPHLPQPTAVYAADGVDLAVVAIWFDAGSRYAEGYNSYAEHRVLRLR